MKKKLIISMLLALNTLCSLAQHVDVKSNVIDCGQVLFRKPVTTVFEFKYKGRNPMRITKVRSSCGCATVEYPQGIVVQNTDFSVKVTYDSKQMGHFEKQVGLYTDDNNKPIILTMKGVVVENVVDYTGDYPYSLGSVLVDKTNIEFDNVNRGDRQQQKIHIVNNSSKEVQPVVMHLPTYLLANVSPSRILPGHSGVITITLDSRSLRDFGLTQTKVYLGMFPGDKVSSDKEIDVSSVLLPSIDSNKDNMALAPKIVMSSTSIDLGSFNGSKKKKGEIYIQNVGKSTLEISNIQMFTMGLQVSLDKTKLKPGEETKMKVTGVAKQLLAAKTRPRVLIITNDPDNSKVVIEIKSRL